MSLLLSSSPHSMFFFSSSFLSIKNSKVNLVSHVICLFIIVIFHNFIYILSFIISNFLFPDYFSTKISIFQLCILVEDVNGALYHESIRMLWKIILESLSEIHLIWGICWKNLLCCVILQKWELECFSEVRQNPTKDIKVNVQLWRPIVYITAR